MFSSIAIEDALPFCDQQSGLNGGGGTYTVDIRELSETSWTSVTSSSACFQFDASTRGLTALTGCDHKQYEYRLGFLPTGSSTTIYNTNTAYINYSSCASQLSWSTDPAAMFNVGTSSGTQPYSIQSSCTSTDCVFEFEYDDDGGSCSFEKSGSISAGAYDAQANSFITFDEVAQTFTFAVTPSHLPLPVNPMPITLTANVGTTSDPTYLTETFDIELLDCSFDQITTNMVIFANYESSVEEQYSDLISHACVSDSTDQYVWADDPTTAISSAVFSADNSGKLTFTRPAAPETYSRISRDIRH